MSVCVYVCLLVMFVSCAKTAEPIEMPFGGLTHVAQGTVVRWRPDPEREGAIFLRGEWQPTVKYRDILP